MGVVIRLMQRGDVDVAEAIHRLAFGTQYGLANPSQFRAESRVVATRWATASDLSFVALLGGEVVGSLTGMDWGSAFILGPLTIRPDCWSQGIARHLIPAFLDIPDAKGAKLTALFTLPNSPKHLRLYESYGFTPKFLTAILEKPITVTTPFDGQLFSKLPPGAQGVALDECRAVADAVYSGLDLCREIRAVARQHLGDTILVRNTAGRLSGFAVCHFGPGTEAGPRMLFVKFAAVRPAADQEFAKLLIACEALAADWRAVRVQAGVNTARRGAYTSMLARGYRAEIVGVAMHRPDQAGYNRPDMFVIDDWR